MNSSLFFSPPPPDPLHTRRARNTREVRLNCERTANEPQYLFFGYAGLYSPWSPIRGLVRLDASGSPRLPNSTRQSARTAPRHHRAALLTAQSQRLHGVHAQKPRQVRQPRERMGRRRERRTAAEIALIWQEKTNDNEMRAVYDVTYVQQWQRRGLTALPSGAPCRNEPATGRGPER